MDSDSTKRIGFVCFMASFIGAMVTLALALEWGLGWWLAPVGAASFGTLAYLGYEWREVGRALAAAWRATVKWRPNLEPNSDFWYGVSLAGGILVGLIQVGWLIHIVPETSAETELTYHTVAWTWIIGALTVLFCTGIPTAYIHDRTERALLKPDGPLANWRQQALFINPLTAPIWAGLVTLVALLGLLLGLIAGLVWLVIKLVKGGLWLIPRLPRAASATVRACITFAVVFFCYLHSEERRICLTATAVGVLAGFAVGYPRELVFLGAIVGGATGSALGMIEYRLARWLRLVPLPAKANAD